METLYTIITPVHNEAIYIEHTIKAVLSQTISPSLWIIVDDGSTDGTFEIICEYGQGYSWIKPIRMPNLTQRSRGAHVAEIFNYGFGFIENNYDYIVKLDGDVSFNENYFESLFNKFLDNPKLGIAGGVIYNKITNSWKLEITPKDHVRGATKVYRRKCFEDIGGIESVNGWDSIDEWRAQMRGWQTRTYEEIKIFHHRPTGASDGKLKRFYRQGEFAFFLGYPWIAIIARSFYRSLIEKPYILGGISIFFGYLLNWLFRKPKFHDTELRDYVKKKQIRRLVFWNKNIS